MSRAGRLLAPVFFLLPVAAMPHSAQDNEFISTTLSADAHVARPNAAIPIGAWVVTGSMSVGRFSFTMTRLPDGRVLAAGGRDAAGRQLESAEIYDPATGSWSLTDPMRRPREGHSATLLSSGKVLVAGGQNTHGELSSAELYNPRNGTWKLTGGMASARACHSATLIPVGPHAGQVLVFGDSCGGIPNASAELYDPATGTWSPTGSMSIARYRPGYAALADGTVLVVGGGTCCPYGEVNEAEIYDPVTGSWTPTGPKATHAEEAAVFIRTAGKVLVAGGWRGIQPNNQVLKDAELFDTTSQVWSRTTSMFVHRSGFTMTLLNKNHVLVVGGNDGGWGVCNMQTSAEVYGVGTANWRSAGNMTFPRGAHDTVRLGDGRALVAGGMDCSGNIWSSAEIYEP